jgi:hypothetical protein
MKLSLQEIARLLAAMKAYSIDDPDDRALIERLEYRLEIMKAEAAHEGASIKAGERQ